MVNVRRFIQQKKEQFYASRDKRAQVDMTERREELKRLQAERVKLEERANLQTSRNRELSRIKDAKSKAPTGMMRFGQGVARVINKGRDQAKSVQAKGNGIDFGGGKSTFGGFGGNSRSNSTFGGNSSGGPFGESKPKPVVKDKTTVIIKVR